MRERLETSTSPGPRGSSQLLASTPEPPRRLALALASLLIAAWVGVAGAAPLRVAKDLATGIHDPTGSKLPARVHDVDWSWNGPTTTRYPFAADAAEIPSTHLADGASDASRWLAHAETPAGSYAFETRVDLSGFDAATARIEGLRIAADDSLVSVSVNATPVFTTWPPGADDSTGFQELGTLGAGAFVAGANLVTVTVQVAVDAMLPETPVALRVEGSVMAELVDPAARSASFQGVGDLAGGETTSFAEGLSADGSTVVGHSGSALAAKGEAFRWRQGSGIEGLGCVENFCHNDGPFGVGGVVSRGQDVSADGEVVAGVSVRSAPSTCIDYVEQAVFTWTAAGGLQTELMMGNTAALRTLSDDATTLAGDFGNDVTPSGCLFSAFLDGWTRLDATTETLDAGDPTRVIRPRAITADGTLLGGHHVLRGIPYTGITVLWDWMSASAPLPIPGLFSLAGLSADGRIVVGADASAKPSVWSAAEGLRVLDAPPGLTGSAQHVSIDGEWILGRIDGEPTIWIREGPARPLRSWLENAHRLDLTGWQLDTVVGLSNDRLTIAGSGTNPQGDFEAWVAKLVPEPKPRLVGALTLACLAGLRSRAHRSAGGDRRADAWSASPGTS